MIQDNRECNDMNSAFTKLRIASDEIDRNISNEIYIRYTETKHFTSNRPNSPEK